MSSQFWVMVIQRRLEIGQRRTERSGVHPRTNQIVSIDTDLTVESGPKGMFVKVLIRTNRRQHLWRFLVALEVTLPLAASV